MTCDNSCSIEVACPDYVDRVETVTVNSLNDSVLMTVDIERLDICKAEAFLKYVMQKFPDNNVLMLPVGIDCCISGKKDISSLDLNTAKDVKTVLEMASYRVRQLKGEV